MNVTLVTILVHIVVVLCILCLVRLMMLRRRKNARLFSKRKSISEDEYINDYEISSPQMRKLAIGLRNSISRLTEVPKECIHADDTIDGDFARLPSFYDGFPWREVCSNIEDEYGINFSWRDIMNMELWHTSKLKSGKSVTLKQLVCFFDDLILEKKDTGKSKQ